MTATIRGINGLDNPLDFGDDGHLSLRNIMMSTRCRSNWELPLFRSVDYNSYTEGYTAMFNILDQEEAFQILGALPVFLEARFGSSVWQWFDPEIRDELAGTTWDHENGCLIETGFADEDLFANLDGRADLAEWEEEDQIATPVESSTSVEVNLDLLFNMESMPISEGYDENQSVATMMTGTSNATQLADSMPLDAVVVINDDSTAEASSLTNGTASTKSTSSRGAGVNGADG